jgi:hypothetical protein
MQRDAITRRLQFLTIPFVEVEIFGPSVLYHLDGDAVLRRTQIKTQSRNWLQLLTRLLNLKNVNEEAEWLTAAGFIPNPKQRIWTEADVSSQIRYWLRRLLNVLLWIARLTPLAYRKASSDAFDYYHNKRKGPLHGDIDFNRAIGAEAHLDQFMMFCFLVGAARSPKLDAQFYWNGEGKPIVTVDIEDPIAGLGIAMRSDKASSQYRWVSCALPECGLTFKQKKSSDRFCANSHKNLFNIRKWRTKRKRKERR